jgi:hypothetical protein
LESVADLVPGSSPAELLDLQISLGRQQFHRAVTREEAAPKGAISSKQQNKYEI